MAAAGPSYCAVPSRQTTTDGSDDFIGHAIRTCVTFVSNRINALSSNHHCTSSHATVAIRRFPPAHLVHPNVTNFLTVVPVSAKVVFLRNLSSLVFVQKMLSASREMEPLALLRFGQSTDNVAPLVLPTTPLVVDKIPSSELYLDIQNQIQLTCYALSTSVHPIPPLRKICLFHSNQKPDRTRALSRDVCVDVQPLHHGMRC